MIKDISTVISKIFFVRGGGPEAPQQIKKICIREEFFPFLNFPMKMGSLGYFEKCSRERYTNHVDFIVFIEYICSVGASI